MHIQLYPQVFAADVVASLSEEEVAVAEVQLRPFIERIPDLPQTRAERIVRALLEPSLRAAGDLEEWYEPYAEAGVDPSWLEKVQDLRIGNRPGFCTVYEMGNLSAPRWHEQDGEVKYVQNPKAHLPLGELYNLGITLHIPGGTAGKTIDCPRATTAAHARRPYPTNQADVVAVDALAAHLAPRVAVTFGGEGRLPVHPVLAPLCAMTATIVIVMKTSASSKGDPRGHALVACLDALNLGPHRTTAERILLRDHPEHIHIDPSAAPERIAARPWRDALGLFARDEKNELTWVSSKLKKTLLPRVLFSLVEPEPM
jgi:hypothetical protein